MKHVVVASIFLYQSIISVFLKQFLGISSSCRFTPTCSAYVKNAVVEHGVIKGSVLSIVRLLSCQPFYPLKRSIQ